MQSTAIWLLPLALVVVVCSAQQPALSPPNFSHRIQPPPMPLAPSTKGVGPCSRGLSTVALDAVGDRLLILANAGCSASAGSFLMGLDLNGSSNHLATLPPAGAVDLQVTQPGRIVVRFITKAGVTFQELTATGEEVSRHSEPLPASRRFAFLESGNVFRLHLDGSTSVASSVGVRSTTLPAITVNSLALPLSANKVLMIDQEFGELTVYEHATGSVARARVQSPEIADSIGRYESIARNAPAGPQGQQAHGKGIVVLDAKVRQDKVFLLVSPYTRTEGALVLQVSPTGAVQRKWRLRFSSVDDTAPSYLSLAGKSICLASTEGSIGCFAIN